MEDTWLCRLRRLVRHPLASLYPYLSYARSLLRGRRQIIRMWPEGPVELGESVAIFIHFDKPGRLGDHVTGYVRALHASGFSVVFITNSGRRFQGDLAVLQPLCRAVIIRRNVGYDFGAIREALELLGLPRVETERLLIANDSVYGPFVPMVDVLARADFEQADVWGTTESWQYRYHLQSYFLLAGRRVMTSEAWQKFWRGVRQVASKEWVIARYEVGLTQKLLKAGFRCRPLWPYHELLDHAVNTPACTETEVRINDPMEDMRVEAVRRLRVAAAGRTALNPTADLWRQLLLDGFPFLKVELLRKNPSGVPDVADWRSVIADIPGADLTVIERDLQQKMRNRSP